MVQKIEFDGIGTKWVIDIYQQVNSITLTALENKLLARIEEFDKNYSRFRTDSLVWRMYKHPGVYKLPRDGIKLFEIYEKLGQTTNEKITPLIGNVLEATGYDHLYSFRIGVAKPLESAVKTYSRNGRELVIHKEVLLDFGAAGKGYLIDILADLIRKNGIRSFCINAGGDIYTWNKKQKVGLENPLNTREVIGVVEIDNQSICASATNRRVWGEYHHIFDPVSRMPTVGVIASWVIAKDAPTADGLATALFLVSAQQLRKDYEFEYLILNEKMEAEYSAGFRKGLFFDTNK